MKMNLDKLFDLTGKVAIVTGAGDGIGKGCAQILAVAGASVVVSDIDIHKAESVVQTIVGQGGKAVACECNVLNSTICKKTVDSAISNFGTVNILVNNAGLGGGRENPFNIDEEYVERIYKINVFRTIISLQTGSP